MGITFVAAAGLEAAPLAGGGAVLYSATTGKFVMLNRSADRLWSELAGGKTEEELVRELCDTYPEIDAGTAGQAVRQTLESLKGLELVTQAEGNGVDRRASASPARTTAGAQEGYVSPSVNILAEDDLLKVFQMTAAEISVALCWWGACSAGCP